MLELRRWAAWLCLFAASAPALFTCSPVGAAEPRPFTVRDGVEWTRILGTGPQRPALSPEPVLHSPDRRRFLIHTRRGDIASSANVERVLAFDVPTVESYTASGLSSPPSAQILAEAVIRQDSNALTSIAWLDEQRVGFLAEGTNEAPQVFVADLASGVTRQVTFSKNGVASFAITGDKLLFYAYREASAALVQGVTDQIIYSVIVPPAPDGEALELFTSSLTSGAVHRIELPAAKISGQYRRIWMSPTGRYGIVLAPALEVPRYWTEYRVGAEESRYTAEGPAPRPDSLAALLSSKLHYILVDLERRQARPLLDAPSGSIAQTFGPVDVWWLDNDRSVIVSHTYLPLNSGEAQERVRRASGPAVAEIDLRTGTAVPIAWEPLAGSLLSGGDFTGLVRSVEWDRVSGTLYVQKHTNSGAPKREYFRKVRDLWKPVTAPRSRRSAMELRVEVRQSLNERPKLYATNATKSAKLLFDPNPGADTMTWGRVEEMNWTDGHGLLWNAGLVYPVGYAPGRKYPLVLQTHGFRQDQFLLDGPGDDVGTAFAAQALANSGFVVLQASESTAAVTNDEREAKLVADGWRAAIDELVDRGLVDPGRVGIVAFSRTCMHAIRFVADFPEAARAVTLADGPWWGYGNQLMLTNYPKSAVDEVRRTTGGKPDPRHLQEWFDAQPLYKLPSSRTAIRIEAMGPGAVVALWETFGVLQNAAHPVDLVYFPKGAHNLMKPAERLGSQDGNVDWFRFWLKDEEDVDPRKLVQYERWRKLRKSTTSRE